MAAKTQVVRLGTRGSPLALVQAGWVAGELSKQGLGVDTIVVRTAADRAPQIALSEIGDKGLWVTDLEQRLLDGTIDAAVHSMKDVPAILAAGLTLPAVPERECPLDALVLSHASGDTDPCLSEEAYANASINSAMMEEALDRMLPRGARVGTSSSRRQGQLLHWRPDLQVAPVRGNVDTRLRKLDSGEWDALVLAAAGLRRLGRSDRISALFPAQRLFPAAGQGALALEIRADDSRMAAVLAPLNHGPSSAAVAAERAFIHAVAGGCSVPLGVYTLFSSDSLELWIRAIDPEPGAGPPLQVNQTVDIPDILDPFADLQWAVECGETGARQFLESGGDVFLERMRGRA